MGSSRHPRFKRATDVPPIQLTKRDCEIIRLVHRHRFLRSSQIVALFGGSSQSILRRLHLLFHHRYLERPRAQIDYYRQGGSRPIVYGLGNKGAILLKEKFQLKVGHLRWNEKNQSVGRLFLEHALAVSDIFVAFELAAEKTPGVTFIRAEALLASANKNGSKPLRWAVSLQRISLGLVPDGVFALDIVNKNGLADRAFFFIEADQGTMPVVRKSLKQTSLYRKLLAYEATWARGLHKTLFGFHRFRVLIVTPSAARTDGIVDACSKLKRGRGLFLICDQKTLTRHENIFEVPWKTGKDETTMILP